MSVRQVSWSNDRAGEWDACVAANPSSGFMQSFGWGEFKRCEGHTVERIGLVTDDDVLVGGSQVIYMRSSAICSPLEIPHGPVLAWEDPGHVVLFEVLKEEWMRLALRENATLARLSPVVRGPLPRVMSAFPRAPLDLVPTPTLLVSLAGTEDDILARMTGKGRYNVRKALANGVEVSSSHDPSALDEFHPLFELSALRHNFPGETRGFFAHLMATLGPSRMAAVYTTRYHGVNVASAIVIFFGKVATFLYGGTSPFLTSAMGSYALHWRILVDARARGCTHYDLYGIAPDDQPAHPYARFSQFKTRFGGEKVDYAGAHDIYFYPQLARLFTQTITKGASPCNSPTS